MKFGKGKGKNVLFVLVGVALLLLVVYFVFTNRIYEGLPAKTVDPTIDQCRKLLAKTPDQINFIEDLRNRLSKLSSNEVLNLKQFYMTRNELAQKNINSNSIRGPNDVKSGIDNILTQINMVSSNFKGELSTNFVKKYSQQLNDFKKTLDTILGKDVPKFQTDFAAFVKDINKSLDELTYLL
jgi:hypothetical protein